MTITRDDAYVPLVAAVVQTYRPVHAITVDGAPILAIYQLKER
jgi:hypothetical protein